MTRARGQTDHSSSRERSPALVLALAGQDRTRAELLHARLAPVIGRLVWSFLGPDAERDDLIHDIFVRILRTAHTVRDPARLEEWAARVTVNAIKNEFRRRKLRRFFSLEDRDESSEPKYHPDFEGRQLLLRTAEILERMPVDERIALTLQLLHESSLDEIASVCDLSVRTVKRRLKSARERFAKLASRDPLLRSRLEEDFKGDAS